MPVQVRSVIGAWLKQLGLVQSLQVSEGIWEISYNDQIYLENGYLIGRLLRSILKARGMSSEALMRIRKIAHISSNENWMIIKEIMKELEFQQEIDPHAIDHTVIAAVLEFVYELFAPKVESKPVKREKKLFIDPASFIMGKSIEQSHNLLQMFLLAAGKAFGVGLGECLGLLVSNAKYFKKAVLEGTTNNGFAPVCQFYKLFAQNMVTVNRLVQQQLKSQAFLMNTICIAAYSPEANISDVFSVILTNLQSSHWLQKEGYVFLLRSPHDRILDILMKRVEPMFSVIFNESLCEKLTDRCSELRTYCRMLHYLYKSMFGKEIFQLLPLGYYLQRAFEIFEPDRIKEQSRKTLLAAKQLCKVAIAYFWNKITMQQRNRICFIFDCGFCSTQQQRLTSLCFLFDTISELSMLETECIPKFYKILNKYYNTCSNDIKSFIIQNIHQIYIQQPDHFPIGFFLETYQISNSVQSYDYLMVDALAAGKNLEMVQVAVLLKICTIYYYQQLHAACFVLPMEKLVKGYGGIQWGQQVSQEILIKWPTLPIPTFQLLPPNTNKIKFRSIGLKKKEMLQFTELNRYKSILRLLTAVKDKQFLKGYARLITTTMKRVQKSKMRQMQNTKVFLNSLLAMVDSKQIQIKQEKQLQMFRAQTMPIRASEIGDDELQSDSFLNQYSKDDNRGYLTPIQQLSSSQNQFMRPPVLPKEEECHLLPFSGDNYDENVKDYTEDGIYQNYQLIYIKNAAEKYKSLLKFIANVYQKSGNIEHFLKSINLYSYFSDDIASLQIIEKSLRMIEDNFQMISFKLTLQMGLSLFQFKKSRRITIKCLQSFYQLLMDKSSFQSESTVVESSQKNEVSINAKIDFKHQIANKILMGNKKHHSYMICFQVISDILKKSIGVAEIEPISCIISQIMPIISKQSSPQSLTKSHLQTSQLDLQQQRQFQQLQKILQDQSSANTVTKNNIKTPSKQKKGDTLQNSLNKGSNKSEKLSIIHKKVSMRRKQLEGRATKALNQT